MLPRFHLDHPPVSGAPLTVTGAVAKHIQVLRLQPGAALSLFTGNGTEWPACITEVTRNAIVLDVGEAINIDRELPCLVTLAIGMPANDRMDWLIEKATELGVSVIQPLMTSRSVLRLDAARADKRVMHWQAVAISACEQSGRASVPVIASVKTLQAWLSTAPLESHSSHRGCLLMPSAPAPLGKYLQAHGRANAKSIIFLSGPEGGLSGQEEALALAAGFDPVHLGKRILRADTAPLMALITAATILES